MLSLTSKVTILMKFRTTNFLVLFRIRKRKLFNVQVAFALIIAV